MGSSSLAVDLQAAQDPRIDRRTRLLCASVAAELIARAPDGGDVALIVSPFLPVPARVRRAVARRDKLRWLPLPLPAPAGTADDGAVAQAYAGLALDRATYVSLGPLEGGPGGAACSPPAAPPWAAIVAALVHGLDPILALEGLGPAFSAHEVWYRTRLQLCARAGRLVAARAQLVGDLPYCLGPSAATIRVAPGPDPAAIAGLLTPDPGSASPVRAARSGRPVAVTGPLPPVASGIATYIEDQSRAATGRVSVEWVETQDQPPDPGDAGPVVCAPAGVGPGRLWWHHVANHRVFHIAQFALIAEYGGVVEVHDVALPFLIPPLLVPPAGVEIPADLRAELAALYRRKGVGEAAGVGVLLRWFGRRADALVVHSGQARDLLQRYLDLGAAPVHVVPHGSWITRESRWSAMGRDFDRPDRPYVVVPGFIGPAKWPEGIIASVAQVSPAQRPLLVFAGRCPPHLQAKLETQAAARGVDLRITGYLTTADFDTWLAGAAATVVGRLVVRGETSGTVLRSARMGTPTIVAARGSISELPGDLPTLQVAGLVASEVAARLGEVLTSPLADPGGTARADAFEAALPCLRTAFSWEPTIALMQRLAGYG